jgi:BirA family biotin operon repressor/biotin-[acetyl-CoA-carboxylase] ligase
MFQTIHRFETIPSTNDEAIRRAKEGADDGEIFVAKIQTKGRGRLGRPWESPAGKCLTFSILLRPSLTGTQAPLLTLVAGAAVHEAIAGALPPQLKSELKIKWPNDIYLKSKKLAGLLAESDVKGPSLRWAVIGIGIDVNIEEKDFSPEVRKLATSLKMILGRDIDQEALFLSLLRIFERRYQEFLEHGFGATRAYIEAHDFLNGKQVHAAEGSLTVTGIVQGVSEEGHLRIKTEAGQIVSIVAGDVRLSL